MASTFWGCDQKFLCAINICPRFSILELGNYALANQVLVCDLVPLSLCLLGNRNILSLKTRCDNSARGCEWIGELCSMSKHLSICGFSFIPCPNNCKESDEILRKDMDEHEKVCPRRQYKCPHCEQVGEYHERTTTHLKECHQVEVPCPNKDCKEYVKRCDIALHCQECIFEEVSCKYASIGCGCCLARKDLKAHEDDSGQHLSISLDTACKQQLTIKYQEDQLAKLQSKLEDLTFKITTLEAKIFAPHEEAIKPSFLPVMNYKVTNFDHHKSFDDFVYSPPFYTSPGGYKMCVKVFANGCGDAKGNHISVYFYLMRGENDDHLPWPLTAKINCELLNELEDRNHYPLQFTVCSENIISKRVVNCEKSSSGYGFLHYISHAALVYDAEKHCLYLKDDCLYFRIKVDAKNISRPWLITI